jgi:Tol biopolymer transport system component
MRRHHPVAPTFSLTGKLGFALAAITLVAPLATDDVSAQVEAADPGAAPTSVFSESPALWYQPYFTHLQVSPKGDRAILDVNRLVDLESGDEVAIQSDLDRVFRAVFDPGGRVLVVGRKGYERVWGVAQEMGAAGDPHLPSWVVAASARRPRVTWSASGDQIAYSPPEEPAKLLLGPARSDSEPREYRLPGPAAAVAWVPDGSAVLVLVRDSQGVGTLYALDSASGASRVLATELDVSWVGGGGLAVSGDGRFAYLALAGRTAPDPESRHDPHADRDLDIFEVDLESGERRPVVQTPAEEISPAFADGALYWISIATHQEIVLVPAAGGAASPVVEDVFEATWRPDGRAIGVTYGDWRTADWGLDMDGGYVELDAEGRATSGIHPLNVGYHEDFSPVWSPDESWIAYHSHRSATPVAGYEAEGSSDDVYLLRNGASVKEEIRLTDFGWEVGTPDWAPDGHRLVMNTWERGGGTSLWILEIDPETGALKGRTQVPSPPLPEGRPAAAKWSPVHDELAIVMSVPGGGTEIWVQGLDGAGARMLVTLDEGPYYGGMDWTPDGETLVYGATADGRVQLFSIPRSGGESTRLTDDSVSIMRPSVSPDGRWIAATRLRHDKRIMRAEM